ncbi:MAG TPA: hypothetical protein VMF06_18825 [Candidatus Limnocylindria bacterium]|nr:hypothetical protein [Candidatus Limnocylindria bacterium]
MSESLFCRVVRLIAGWKLDGGQTPGPKVSRHLATCPDCHAWVTAQTSVILQMGQLVTHERQGWANQPRMIVPPLSQRTSTHWAGNGFPWSRLLSVTGACAAVLTVLAVWQPWQSPTTADPSLEQWQLAFKATLKKAQEPVALEREFQAALLEAQRAMTAMTEGVASRDLIAGLSGGQ